jgi:hypothetical protein
MKFFASALAVGLALLQATEAASSGPAVERRDDALPAFRMPYPSTGRWKSHYDDDVRKYGYGGGPVMHYGQGPDGRHKDACKGRKPGGSGGKHGGKYDGGHGGHGHEDPSTGPVVVHDNNNDDSNGGGVDTPPSTNNQTIACSAGTPFCCFADNGSTGGEFVVLPAPALPAALFPFSACGGGKMQCDANETGLHRSDLLQQLHCLHDDRHLLQ